MKDGFKNAAVFIGTVIGAGFATGQEVALYFGKSAPVVAVFSGILLGFLCSLFMYAGKLSNGVMFLDKKWRVFSSVSVFICSFITFIAMFSGSEQLIMSIFNVRHIGIIAIIIASLIAYNGMKGIKILNALAVPMITIFIALIFICNKVFFINGNYNFLNSVAYASMNIMLAGTVMYRLGKNATVKSISTAGITSGLILSLLLMMIILTVSGRTGSMPMLEAAIEKNLKIIAGVVIFLAIFTTMVSALETCAKEFSSVIPDKRGAVFTLCLMAFPLTLIFDFEQIINYFYPVVSVFGAIEIVYCVYIVASLKKNNF